MNQRPMIRRIRPTFARAAFALGVLVPSAALAQRPPVPAPPQPTPAAPAAPIAPAPAAAAPMPDLVKAAPGGLTGDQVAKRAAQTSYTAAASQELIRAAAERVDAAWANYLPRLTGTARYTRISDFTGPQLGPGLRLDPILNQYLFQAAIVVPISDYFLRINQQYTSTTHGEQAARYDLITAKAKSAADGKIAYYGWLTAQAALVVADATLELQKTLVQDAKNQFAVGNASKSDVLQAESAVAAAELAVERAKNLVRLTERQVRVAMHAPDDEVIKPGEDFDRDLPPFEGTLVDMRREAIAGRYEIKSVDANAESALAQARAARSGRYPAVSGFGDVTYANPNPRKFPQREEWFPTWAVGAQLVWSPNDILIAGAGASEIEARAASLQAQKGVVRDGIDLEVTEAYQTVKEAEVAQATTKRQLESAGEGYRVARELFTHGRATATQVREAETAFTRARLESINAKAQARTARVKLEHALGRTARDFAADRK